MVLGRGRVIHWAAALVAALAVLWGGVISPAPQNEFPPPQETGWNHRNYR